MKNNQDLVWIVRVNPNGSCSYYTKKGQLPLQKALSFCSSYQAFYNKQYPDLNYRFETRSNLPTNKTEGYAPMLYYVYDNTGRLMGDTVTFKEAQIMIGGKDWTCSEAC